MVAPGGWFSPLTLPESKVLPIAPMGSPPSAGQRTPWPRPRQSRGLWPEARWSEGAAPPSRPCRTGTAAPEPKRSDDPPHAPWFASATQGLSVYPQPQPSGIPADPFSRSPYDSRLVGTNEGFTHNLAGSNRNRSRPRRPHIREKGRDLIGHPLRDFAFALGHGNRGHEKSE